MDAKDLVARRQAGEEQALAELYTAHVRRLERVCRRYVQDEADVQDIVHDAFIIIFTSLGKLKDPSRLEAWMATITKNLALKHVQRMGVTKVSIEKADEHTFVEPAAVAADYAEWMAMVEQLPNGYQRVFKLSVLEGLSHKEIGELLGIEPHTSSSQLTRAKSMLRAMAKTYGMLLLLILAFLIPALWLSLRQPEPPKTANVSVPNDSVVGSSEPGQLICEQTPVEPVTPTKPKAPATSIKLAPNEPILPEVNKTNEESNEPTTDETSSAPAVTPQPTDSASSRPQIVPTHSLLDDRRLAEGDKDKTHRSDDWSLALAFTGGAGINNQSSLYIPGSGNSLDNEPGEPERQVDTRRHHYMPITFSLALSRSLSPRWRLETGLRYTFLRSDVTTVTTVPEAPMPPLVEKTTQEVHYIGIPLKSTYRFWHTSHLSLYTTGGVGLDIPVSGSSTPLWSFTVGLGAQYQLTPRLSLYAEPAANYYLNAGSGLPTLRTDRPLNFALPIGLRLSW